MPKKVVPLTDSKIRASKPREKNYTLPDGDGLQLLIKSMGSKLWEFVYTSPTKDKRRKTSFGVYPDVTLVHAREKRSEFRTMIANGLDPVDESKKNKEIVKLEAAGQFHRVVEEWINQLPIADGTKFQKLRKFERDLFPHFSRYDSEHELTSSVHITEIAHNDLLTILQEKAKIAQETASRILSDCRNIWQFAYEKAYIEDIVTDKISKKAIPKPAKTHYPKITDEALLGELLRSIDNYTGQPITRFALKFVSVLPLRSENLTTLQWDMIDFDENILTIPRNEMKIKDKNLPDFVLPLPQQIIELLHDVKKLTGWGKWVFHGVKDIHSPMHNETANKALRAMGFGDKNSGRKQTLHSFRGTFRSLVETYQSEHNANFETKERVLDHHEKNAVVRTYAHKADYTDQMRELLQWWADFIDEVKK